jgi:hypothetical protein
MMLRGKIAKNIHCRTAFARSKRLITIELLLRAKEAFWRKSGGFYFSAGCPIMTFHPALASKTH